MRLAILALCLCAVACGENQPVIGQSDARPAAESYSRRLYPSAVVHYMAPTFVPGDSVQIRWSGLVVEVSHERILVCSTENIATGGAIDTRPILWSRVVPGRSWFTVEDEPIERPAR